LRLNLAGRAKDHKRVLALGDQVLLRDPWDVATELAMAQAAEALGLNDVAVWMLEEARPAKGQDTQVNRSLARLYAKTDQYSRAISLWELVLKAEPGDTEATQHLKNLSAREAIARSKYRPEAPGARKRRGRSERG